MVNQIGNRDWLDRLLLLIEQIYYQWHSRDEMKRIIQEVSLFRRDFGYYKLAKKLYEKYKNKTITTVELRVLNGLTSKFHEYKEEAKDKIKALYTFYSKVYLSEGSPIMELTYQSNKFIRHCAIDLVNTYKKSYHTKPNIQLPYVRSIHNPLLMKRRQINKKQIKAIGITTLIISSFAIGIFFYCTTFCIDTSFSVNNKRVDVNQEITFNWNVLGSYSRGVIIFGDGSSIELNDSANTLKHSYSVQGKYAPVINVWNQYGISTSKSLCVEIKNDAPQFEVSVPNSAREDEPVRISVVDLIESEVDLESGILNYVYDFADNNQTTSSQNSIIHKWENAGRYPVTITIFDDQSALSQKTEYIEIINKAPEAYFDHTITEGVVEFNAEFSVDTDNDFNSLMYIWDFGDNHKAFGKFTRHAYDTLGHYTVELCVKDDNGAVDYVSKMINIEIGQTNGAESNETGSVVELDILGPYTLPQNIEGQMVNLDVEVYDSLENEANMSYSWYQENGVLISNDKRPSILLDDGDYRFTLNATNQNSQIASENISLKVNNIAPEVFVSNYVYNGPNIDVSDGAELELSAYGYDSMFDVNKLKFYWTITDGEATYTFSDNIGKATSTMIFTCTDTVIYRGQVKVVDPSGKESVAIFFVNVIIDNNKNSVPDTIEQLLSYTGESLETFSDADNDLISDEYEQWVLHTNFVNSDTDGDGL